MASPPPSPSTTRHRRRPSSISSNIELSNDLSSSRFASQYSPTVNSRRSSHGGFGVTASNELGDSLAAELEGAWDDEDYNVDDSGLGGEDDSTSSLKIDTERPRDSGIDVASPGSTSPIDTNAARRRRKHARQVSYDGDGYEDDVGGDVVILYELERQLDEVARLAACSLEAELSSKTPIMASVDEELTATSEKAPTAVARFATALRDLSTLQQSSLESHTSRLITAHSALASHLALLTRNLQSVIFPLTSPLATLVLDEASIEALLPVLTSTISALPHPTHSALSSISSLHQSTSSLTQSLSSLTDTLHMSRQTLGEASRRLRSARDMVTELRKEEDAAEKGRQWIESGGWEQKLAAKDAKSVCGDVVGGFERVCEDWRERLVQQLAVQAAG